MLLGFIVGLMVTWAFVSLASLPPLNGPLPATEAAGPLVLLAIAGVALYGFAAFRSFRFYIERGGVLVLAVAVALVLLGEAMLAIAISRNWQLSWWLWHVLMLVAFLAIALGTRAEYQRSGSLTGAFGGLYLEATLARIDRWHARAIAAVAAAGTGPMWRIASSTTCGARAPAATRSPLSPRRPKRSSGSTPCSGRTSRHTSRAGCGTSPASGGLAAWNAR